MKREARAMANTQQHPNWIYECGGCGCYHPWEWQGDCRDDANRFGAPEDYEAKFPQHAPVEVRSMDDRLVADLG